MGVFDTVNCEFPLFGACKRFQNVDFQTKNLTCTLSEYTIKKDGMLVLHKHNFLLQESDGKIKDGAPINEIVGSFKAKKTIHVKYEYTGELEFYSYVHKTSECVSFRAYFVGGILLYLRDISKEDTL